MSNQDIRIQLDLKIPMRDGVRLYGALYRPIAGDKFPVLLIRSPYSTQHPRYVDWAVRFAQSGYAVVMQDSRGRYDSEGLWRPYIDETNDGYDTQQWLGAHSLGVTVTLGPSVFPIPDLHRFCRRLSGVPTSKLSFRSLTKRTITDTCGITVSCSFRTP